MKQHEANVAAVMLAHATLLCAQAVHSGSPRYNWLLPQRPLLWPLLLSHGHCCIECDTEAVCLVL